MVLKREANLNGCHSPTVGRKYKSSYPLGGGHKDISTNAINFYSLHIKGFLKVYVLPKKGFQSSYYGSL